MRWVIETKHGVIIVKASSISNAISIYNEKWYKLLHHDWLTIKRVNGWAT